MIDTLTEVDVFFPNETEIRGITGREEVVDGLRAIENGHTLLAGKLGAEGCIALHEGKWTKAGTFPVEVVDTTGAGDSFDAGFLHAWLRGRPLQECLHFAAACGALSTRGLGTSRRQVEQRPQVLAKSLVDGVLTSSFPSVVPGAG